MIFAVRQNNDIALVTLSGSKAWCQPVKSITPLGPLITYVPMLYSCSISLGNTTLWMFLVTLAVMKGDSSRLRASWELCHQTKGLENPWLILSLPGSVVTIKTMDYKEFSRSKIFYPSN